MALPLGLEIQTLLRLALGSWAVLYWWPRLALPQFPKMARADRIVSNIARGLLVLMISGYVLTALKIFELPTLVGVLLALTLWYRPRPEESRYVLSGEMTLVVRLFSVLDNLPQYRERWIKSLRGGLRRPRLHLGPVKPFTVVAGLGLAALFGVVVWMRFWFNLQTAAYPYSDAYVVLSWVENILQQHLYPNGIYPEGFHLLIASMRTLTESVTMVFVKFFGPTVGVAMVASVAFATYRFTGRLAPALVAALIYGTLPAYLPNEIGRQIATDSQEFGNALVLPAAWFFYRAWVSKDIGDRVTAVALLTSATLAHTVAALNTILAALAGTVAGWVAEGMDRGVFGWFARYVSLAALVSIAPIAIALALGIHFYASSLQFLSMTTSSAPPPISPEAKVAVGCCLALLAVRMRRGRAGMGAPLTVLLLLLAALMLQQSPLLGIKSEVLAVRSGEMLALVEALSFGLGWSALQETVALLGGSTAAAWLALAGAFGLGVAAWAKTPPKPIVEYTMNSGEYVATFVSLRTHFLPTTWLAVSDDYGYSLVLGDGFQMGDAEFVSRVSPDTRWPQYKPPNQPAYPIAQAHIFFLVNTQFHVPNIPGSEAAVAAALQERKKVNTELIAWLNTYQQKFGPLKVYFRGKNLVVYELDKTSQNTPNLGRNG